MLTRNTPRTDTPATLVDQAPPVRAAGSTQNAVAVDDAAEHGAETGSFAGFLLVALKAALRAVAHDAAEQQELTRQCAASAPKGEVRAFLDRARTVVEAAQSDAIRETV